MFAKMGNWMRDKTEELSENSVETINNLYI